MSLYRRQGKTSEFLASESIKNDSARVLISAKMDKDALILWQYVYENVPNWIEITVKDDCNDEVKPSSCSEGDKLNITLKCIAFENNRYIFTLEGWNVFLHNDDLVSITNKVNILGLKHGFETLGYSVEPWNHAPEKLNLMKPYELQSIYRATLNSILVSSCLHLI